MFTIFNTFFSLINSFNLRNINITVDPVYSERIGAAKSVH